MSQLTVAQLTGLDHSHLAPLAGGHQLHPEAAAAWHALCRDARDAGFELAIASSHRDYGRQLAIWNAKAAGRRPVHDDAGAPVDMAALGPEERLHAILRYSALPGTSRHHWGTDLDVFDAAAVAPDYKVQLTPGEVAPGGPFDPLHRWLDERMAGDRSHGFHRPYGKDRGGVAPERWHLSYAPLARDCGDVVGPAALRRCWDAPGHDALLLRETVEARLEELLARYVAVAPDWCPGPG